MTATKDKMILQILRRLKGKGTTTDIEQRPFNYLHKLAEIEYEEMSQDVLEVVKEVTNGYDLKNEIRFHKEPEDRIPWDNDKTNIV